jgi:hypothetical protein
MTGAKYSGKGGGMKHVFLLPLCLPLFFSACGADVPSPHLNCPDVRVLAQTSSMTAFLPGRQDAGAEVFSAHITGVAGSCVLASDGVLRVTFQAGFTATNGPANHGRTVSLPYFVAETKGDAIISKIFGTVDVPFDGNLSTAAVTSKSLSVEVPNSGSSGGAEILVGFQLSQDELAYAAAHPGP